MPILVGMELPRLRGPTSGFCLFENSHDLADQHLDPRRPKSRSSAAPPWAGMLKENDGTDSALAWEWSPAPRASATRQHGRRGGHRHSSASTPGGRRAGTWSSEARPDTGLRSGPGSPPQRDVGRREERSPPGSIERRRCDDSPRAPPDVTIELRGEAGPRPGRRAGRLRAPSPPGTRCSPEHQYHRPRGPFCMAASCSQCLMRVDGLPNRFTCQTPVHQDAAAAAERLPQRPGGRVRQHRLALPRGLDHHSMFAGVSRWPTR
mgnify:CR=1 FL=1